MQPTTKVEGMERLSRKLDELARSVDPEHIEPILLDGARVIAEDAREKAPLGPTGNLKRSLTAKLMKRTGHLPPVAIAAVDRKIAPHAHLVEFGTSHAPAHPFFRPAVDESAERVLRDIEDKVKGKIEEAAR